MATTPEASDADLRNRLRGEPGVTPEDTRSELLQDGQDKVLRDNLRGVPGVAPEDTHSELLAEKAKEERKALYDQVQDYVVNEQAYILPLYVPRDNWAASAAIQGINVSEISGHIFSTVAVWRAE